MERVSPHQSKGLRCGLERQACFATMALFLGVVGVAVTSAYLQWTISTHTEQALDVEIPRGALAREIMLQVSQCEQADRDFEIQVKDTDARGEAIEAWRTQYDRLKALLESHDEFSITADDHTRLARWGKKRSAYGQAMLEIAEAVARGDLHDASTLHDAMNACRSNASELGADVEAYAQSQTDAKHESSRAVQSAIKAHTRLTNACVVIALLVLMLGSLWVTRGILRRLVVVTEAIERFANGNRTIRVSCETNDELGLLAQRFNDVVSSIQSSGNDLEQANQAVSDASQAKSRLLESLSRELRPPTTALVENIDMIMDNLRNPENMEAARTIRSKGEHLLGIMNNLHDWSQIEAGSLQIEKAPCDISRITAEVASAMRVRATARGLELKVEHEGPIPQGIRTDATRLSQILFGLVGAAIQSTEIGEVHLVARYLPGKDGRSNLQFDVVDTGIGWTDKEMDHLFDPFANRDLSEQRGELSVGLGLTLAKQLTDMLGGTITMTSAVGSGSKFSVSLDVETPAEASLVEHANEATAGEEQEVKRVSKTSGRLDCRILLAEDGPENQRLISFILSKAGANVSVAENGQVAVEMVLPEDAVAAADSSARSADPFDLILMDMQMPVMDGYEATRILRQRGYLGPIVAVTGDTLSFTRQKCIDAGCDDYMSKPVERAQLLAMAAQFSSSEAKP